MSFWTAIVIIVGMTIIGSIIRSRHNALNGFATDKDGNPIANSARERELEAELTELRERIKVLERIATDGHETQRLAAEIDKLRDQ